MGFRGTISYSACYEFDREVARFGRWAEGRMREMTGGKRPQPKYPTLGEALGMQDEDIMSPDSDEMQAAADAFMTALVAWEESGADPDTMPDPAKYVPELAESF